MKEPLAGFLLPCVASQPDLHFLSLAQLHGRAWVRHTSLWCSENRYKIAILMEEDLLCIYLAQAGIVLRLCLVGVVSAAKHDSVKRMQACTKGVVCGAEEVMLTEDVVLWTVFPHDPALPIVVSNSVPEMLTCPSQCWWYRTCTFVYPD